MAGNPTLKLGLNVDGHSYIGGDPHDPSSWINADELAATGKSGDDFLSIIQRSHPSLVPTIKSLSEGRLAVPSGRAQTDPYWQTIFTLANQYDPSLDAASYPARVKVRKDFTSGTSAQNLRNINQAIGHLHGLSEQIPLVAGHSGFLGLAGLLNKGINAYEEGAGDPGISSYNDYRTALANELASVFKGKGSSSETEITKFYNMLDPSRATIQKYAGVRNLADMMQTRLDEMSQQYNQGMGTTKKGMDLLDPQVKQIFPKLSKLGQVPDAPTYDDKTKSLLQKYGVVGAPQ